MTVAGVSLLLTSIIFKTFSKVTKANLFCNRSPLSYFYWIMLWHLHYRFDVLRAAAEFHYSDFSNTSGLVFNGDAYVATTCTEDARDSPPLHYQVEEGSYQLSSVVETVTAYNKQNKTVMEKTTAIFGHRYDNVSLINDPSGGCQTRLRLTPSHPSNVGSVWYEKAISVVRFGALQSRFGNCSPKQLKPFFLPASPPLRFLP